MSEQKKFSQISLENGVFETHLTRKFGLRRLYEKQDPRFIKAVIPGVIAEISAGTGKAVKRGDTVLVLEAMKMLNRIKALQDGTVRAVRVKVGEKVAKGQLLMEIE
jgi:biotin carboxyl carrier protein